ncbi:MULTISPECIES: membrane protein [Rhizobium]|uniref:Tetratricopeptide repeat-containing protein n=2 Tax=Rhizobium TaxID=379 RepID=A0A192T3B7_9HYPH|nr:MULTISPECIES: membrane protein [Rhizobium]MDH6647085.1 TolB-like protein [Rhizobium esperanzae]ANL38561.1 tetratricopeptide repeat-containing protein [Rhizobium phaseoli]ANL51310.1 tetratricopeptide repeat-containing protein [Rhizobium phaseoli]ANL57550.1 tetratricopeptide repeat-containing protein [Rhizobium phaseoli]ANL82942.1 tetratricopeptide repeat-containing protein [Rhizobium phaseoli]
MTSAGINRVVASQEDVQQQLERILSSREFRLPERARRFLEFVVTETLAGRRDYLKAFTIAQAVFGRDANFDAQQDPCVRIEAGRLRRELEHYYLTAGAADRIIITIPKGGYAPVFDVIDTAGPADMELPEQPDQPGPSGDDGGEINTAADTVGREQPDRRLSRPLYWLLAAGVAIILASAAALLQQLESPKSARKTATTIENRPTILVERFESVSDGGLASDISRGITDDIIEKLVRFNDIVVVTAMPRIKTGQVSSEPLYALQGSVRLEGSQLRSTARLVRRVDAAVIWASNYDADMKVQGIPKTQASLAGDIAAAVARPFGVMFQTDTAAIAGNADAFSCVLSYYSYRSEMTVQAHEAAKSCLQRAVEEAPADSNVAALLSLIHLDEFRFSYQLHTKSTAATLGIAKDLAVRAVQLDPKNARALQALMLADFFGNDPAEALRAGAAAYASNPNDTEVAGEYGLRLSMSGEWDKGCTLISEAVGKNAGPRGYYQVGMALCAFMRGDTQAAELWSRMSDLNYNPMHRLVLLSILGALGKQQEAKEQLDWIRRESPALIPNIRREVVSRLARPQDQQRFLAGIEAAGLSVQNGDAPGN